MSVIYISCYKKVFSFLWFSFRTPRETRG